MIGGYIEVNLNFVFETNNVEMIVMCIKSVYITIFTYFTNFKIVDKKVNINLKETLKIIAIIFFSIVLWLIRYQTNYLISIICSIFIISIIFSSKNIKQGILTTIISLSINYAISLLSIMISYVLNKIIRIENDYVNVMILLFIHLLLLFSILSVKRLKYGISSIKSNKQNEYIDVLILNTSVLILLISMVLDFTNIEDSMKIVPIMIMSAISMVITIQKSIYLYYKQKVLIQDLNHTKEELEKKNSEIQKLEQENLNFSKKSHSLAHKQKSLEYKLNQLMLKNEISDEIDLKDRLESISKELYENTAVVELTKTDIPEIDDMLQFMQAECKTNNIDFNLQISGNLYYMINNLITKEELEILIADHIKDAIIAIKHTNNVNKSILVRLGKIDECYGLYIYDSGIEFEKETLENLGKKPSTTHADEGGTGMGFMNTFDTLRKYKASLIIHEIGAPSKDNYTKVLMIKFDNKNEFKVISYKEKI